jgi:hypothetical protein
MTMTPIPGEEVPEITELRFSPKPFWLVETTAKTILVATFANGKQAWVSWRPITTREATSAKNFWNYFMMNLAVACSTLEHIYLRDIEKVPRFQRVVQYPVEGIE